MEHIADTPAIDIELIGDIVRDIAENPTPATAAEKAGGRRMGRSNIVRTMVSCAKKDPAGSIHMALYAAWTAGYRTRCLDDVDASLERVTVDTEKRD